ncbi:MAG TPA: pitrilysin family protein [Steroidobacteraceae bacterium]|nr:pitrilysin family protein [Steroidobacteraceae bacterium]
MMVRVPQHERLSLGNGVALILVPRREVPLVAFNAVLRGGALGDPPSRPGVASLVAGLLEKGAGERSAYAFADIVEGVGGSFGAGAGAEAISVRGQFLARDQRLMLELLADALLRPALDGGELEDLAARHIELIKAAKDSDPAELIDTYGRAFLFADHPYARPVFGSEASLAAIERQDVLRYYDEQFGAERLILVLAGDIDADLLARGAAESFSRWPRTVAPVPAPAPARALAGRRVLLVDFPGSAQTYFWVGNVGVDKRYPRRAALDLVNTLFGGRFTSLLNTELRIKSGLSYGARSSFTRGSAPGEFSLRSFAQTENTGRALELSLRTLDRLRSEGLRREMLDSARAYILGQYPLGLETDADWAGALAEIELYGLGKSYIDDYPAQLAAVGVEEAQAVIEEAFPRADSVAIVAIGDAARIRSEVTGFGPLSEMALTDPEFFPPKVV